jgi:DNA-binding CsgD family transcriptional regulator
MLESDYNTNDIDDKIGVKKEVRDALDSLKEREKDVIKMHFGIGVDKPMSIEEIGEEFGLTRERVRQIKEKAIRRLRCRGRGEKLLPYAISSPSAKKEAREKISNYSYGQKYSRKLSSEYKKRKTKRKERI